MAEICSSRHPPAIVSESNSLTIVTSETQAEEYAFTFDFRAYYTVLDNGKYFTKLNINRR